MRHSFRSLLLSSALGASLLAAPLVAQGGHGTAGKAGAEDPAQSGQPVQAEQPAQPETPAQPDTNAPQPPENRASPTPQSKADLRTFGGTCILNPVGDFPQVGALAAAFIPQLVGAGVDALTAALEAAGQDRTLSQSAVVALENSVTCIQVARGVTALSGYDSRTLRNAVNDAPFLVELFLRQSADGSALLVAPTLLNYQETLDRHRTSRPRTLYVTLTFTEPGGQRTSAVTVPLGIYATRRDQYRLDAVGAPLHPDGFSSLGAANSVWIPNPFRRVGSTELEVPDQPETQAGNPPSPQSQGGQPAAQPAAAQGSGGSFGDAAPHHTPVNPAAPEAGQPSSQPSSKPVGRGTEIMPMSITVAITEVRPGSALARFLAGVLRGSRTGVVNALDPTQREAVRQTELAAAAQLATNIRDAEKKYDDAFRAFCGAAPAERITKVSDLREAHLDLLAALQAAHQPPRYGEPINARVGPTPAEEDALCRGYPNYVSRG